MLGPTMRARSFGGQPRKQPVKHLPRCNIKSLKLCTSLRELVPMHVQPDTETLLAHGDLGLSILTNRYLPLHASDDINLLAHLLVDSLRRANR
jgi:hypothetical protein